MVSGDNELISPFQLPNFKFKTQIQNLEMAISNNPLNKTTARPLHYWLRPIKRGQFRFANFDLILGENVTFTF